MIYHVELNQDGQALRASEHASLGEAVEAAASLAGVTARTIRRRMREWSHPSGCWQVGGAETGQDGVWIEERE